MEKDVESFVMEDALGFVINRVSIVMRKKLTYLFKKEGYDIAPEEFVILSHLWEEDDLFQSVINDKTLKDKTTFTPLLERLIKGPVNKLISGCSANSYVVWKLSHIFYKICRIKGYKS